MALIIIFLPSGLVFFVIIAPSYLSLNVHTLPPSLVDALVITMMLQ